MTAASESRSSQSPRMSPALAVDAQPQHRLPPSVPKCGKARRANTSIRAATLTSRSAKAHSQAPPFSTFGRLEYPFREALLKPRSEQPTLSTLAVLRERVGQAPSPDRRAHWARG